MNYDVATVNELKEGLISAYAQLDYEDQLRSDIQGYEDEINRPYQPHKKGILGVAKEKSKALYWGLILLPVATLLIASFGAGGQFAMFSIYYWVGFAVLAWIVRKLQIDEDHAAMVREMRAKQAEAQSALNDELNSADRGNRLSAVPVEMQDISVVSTLYNILDSGRADSWKETLHVYDDMVHRARVENSQAKLLEAEQNHLDNIAGLHNQLANLRAEVADGNEYWATRDLKGRGIAAAHYAAKHNNKKGLAGWLGL